MIVVSVRLESAIDASRSKELARMVIDNIGGTNACGNYRVRTVRGRCKEALDKYIFNRHGEVHDYPRDDLHVWHLVAEALKAVDYHRRPKS